MSVRRLADDAVQPTEFAFTPDNAEWAKRKISDYPEGRQASAVIPLLMRAQEQEGWVTKAAIEHVAAMLDMPLIRVLEVATFYTQFQLAPVGKRAHVQVCGTTPCMLRGAEELMDVCRKTISPNQFEISEDGNLSWEEVECQGACVNAPMIMIFKDTYEDVTPRQMEHIIDRFQAGRGEEIRPGPQVDRVFSAPAGGLTSLTEDPNLPDHSRPGSGRTASPQAATEAGRPASHVPITSPAVDTPVDQEQSAEAKSEAKEAREESGGRSPKRRAQSLKIETGKADPKPAEFRDPEPKELKSGSAKTAAATHAGLDDANRPPSIEKPADPDNLKLISGIGPKIENTLNGLGIYKYEQIARWEQAEREWIDGYLRFKGQIDRDDWVRQADALAKGGREEYVRVFGKEPR